ncbi:MAG: CDP-alcohol phosphatidyltransferase family protein [Candidatus Methanoperedens sp.]|jgi:CDP-diacylglycerol--glycerol-3-phosphate 3-phosphatidyltransferase/archaetidylinositol phosphate synthase|nr:CDP-alcohol phosphatidyltransferase family protein [Candidatus Methanoperedens sp.]PKL52955.1 MAG: CDP-alcohol phosphatidyltransferase family protein [Candidatus Methanoperedenaceae archaeon HGW-Methanoperedenaceae-1]
MLGKYREKYQKILLPFGKIFAVLSISPNTLTILSLIASAGAMVGYMENNLLLGVFFILVTGFFDIADGTTARYTKTESRFGTVLDHVVDRYAEFFIITGIVLGGYVSWLWGFAALFGMIMASFTRAKAESVGGMASCTVGIAERQEKLILVIIGSLAQVYYDNALLVAIVVVAVVSHITVVQRLLYAKKEIVKNR